MGEGSPSPFPRGLEGLFFFLSIYCCLEAGMGYLDKYMVAELLSPSSKSKLLVLFMLCYILAISFFFLSIFQSEWFLVFFSIVS